ncbi:hypothetical protein HYDPIDRAFT_54838, partial [Hydnomerulius pinastri MD-312]
KNMTIDPTPVALQSQHKIVTGNVATRIRTAKDGFPHLIFEPRDIAMLVSPTDRINDVCINGCIPLLFSAMKIP